MDAGKLTGFLPGAMTTDMTPQWHALNSVGMHWMNLENKTKMNLVQSYYDHFEDDTGWVANNGVSAGYQSGDRTSTITVTTTLAVANGSIQNFVNGNAPTDNSHGASDGYYWNNCTNNVAGKEVKFQWASAQTITGARVLSANSDSQGTWKWQGSNNASDCTDIGSSFALNLSSGWNTSVGTQLNSNTTAYTYYQLIGVSGNGSHTGNQTEIEFGTGTPSANGLGTDASGEGNHFTPTNIATSDQVTDTPTNNFCTFNSIEDNIHRAGHFGEGNLEGAGKTGSSFHMGSVGTMHTTNKIYYEVYLSNQSNPDFFIGIAPDDYSPTTSPSNDWGINLPGQNFHGACIYTSINTLYYDGSSTASFTTSAATGNILSCAFDPATGKIWFANNGTWYGSGNPSTGANPAATLSNLTRSGGASHSWKPCVGQYQLASRMILNCGQEGTFAGNVTAGGNADDNGYGNFKYSVPTGFLALCSANLLDPAVKPKENFNTVLYTGNSSAPRTITGVGFQPDMTWIKPRTLAGSWTQVDSVRGGNGSYLWRLASDYGQIESNLSGSGYVRSFASDGFVLGNDQHVNTSYNYLSWNWKTSSTSSGTTSGSGTSKSYTAKYNADAGFSIIGYEGNGTSGHQIPHHLGAPPELIIVKARNYNGTEWAIGTEQTLLSMDWNHVLYFDQAVAFSNWNLWHDTAPNNTHFYVSSMVSTNHNGNGMIAYCWRSIPGYCKIGSYQGVSDADGAFIYTGFRPAMVIIKNVNQSGNHFVGFDNVRSPTNPSTQFIFPSDHAVENTSNGNNLDFLSNGIKFRKSDGWYNHGNYKYLYMAFAEQPFKYSNAK